MLFHFISWLWILLTSFCTGFGVLRLVKGKQGVVNISLEYMIVWGLCVITVYAQAFSLVHKVGGAATIVLGVSSLLVLVIWYREVFSYFRHCFYKKHLVLFCIIGIAAGGIFLWLSSGYMMHPDTVLYHAQAIRWLEEYGIVKGLGNLHNRLAYNSSFFPLQALYSLKFAANQSLHSVNGFAAVVFILYSFFTLSVWKKEKLKVSDCLKLSILLYCAKFESLGYLSSPGSDHMTMLMVLYLSAKWMELVEKGCGDMVDYGLICLLAVWCATLKLSAAMMSLLALYPAVKLIQKHKWKTLAVFCVSAVGIVLPFLTRNVIISGYLLYPYPSIDLFRVDWKMPAALADYDRIEIMAWGRQLGYATHDTPFLQWFPNWYRAMNAGEQFLFWANLICIVGIAVVLLCRGIKGKGSFPTAIFYVVCTVQLNMWFWTAPLTRYGGAYLLLLPSLALGMWFASVKSRKVLLATSWGLAAGIFCIVLFRAAAFDHKYVAAAWKRPMDYLYTKDKEVILDGKITAYTTLEMGTGYHSFPGTVMSPDWINAIELRGNGIEDGFRMKEEYYHMWD